MAGLIRLIQRSRLLLKATSPPRHLGRSRPPQGPTPQIAFLSGAAAVSSSSASKRPDAGARNQPNSSSSWQRPALAQSRALPPPSHQPGPPSAMVRHPHPRRAFPFPSQSHTPESPQRRHHPLHSEISSHTASLPVPPTTPLTSTSTQRPPALGGTTPSTSGDWPV